MCRIENSCSQKLHSRRSPTKRASDELRSELELSAETPVMMAPDFCGEWTTSDGDEVEVRFSNTQRAQLRATLVKRNGYKKSFLVGSSNSEWWCGSAVLVESSSKDQLQWQFGHGGVSTWYRQAAFPSPPLAVLPLTHAYGSEGQCTSLHLPLPSKQADESLEELLSGCLSPTEEYFNPGLNYLQLPWNADIRESDTIQSLENSQFFLPPAESIAGNVWKLSRDDEGCRRVQEALSEGDNHSRIQIANELRGHVWKAAEHRHANFVLQKCIQELTPEASSFIVDELKTGVACLARSNTGVRVFQRLLEHCRDQVEEMIGEVLDDARNLCVHQYGNYIMQHILEHGSMDQRRTLATLLLKCLDKRMCSNEYGVAVIGKALQHAPMEERQAIAEALLKDKDRFVRIAMQRHGKVAIMELLKGPGEGKARELLVKNADQLTSRHSKRVLKDAGICQ